MTGHPGAIILIVYYALKRHKRTKTRFSPQELFDWISSLRKEPHGRRVMQGLVDVFMKHHRKPFPSTLEEVGRLAAWLRLHVNGKPIFWFTEHAGQFQLKEEYLSRLDSYMLRLRKTDR